MSKSQSFIAVAIATLAMATTVSAQPVRQAQPTFIDFRLIAADDEATSSNDAKDKEVSRPDESPRKLPKPNNVNSKEPPVGNDAVTKDVANTPNALALADVIASLYRSYPDIALAREAARLAGGEHLAALGTYDTKLGAYTLSEPLGFYENYRQGIGVARQTWWGGYLSAGYRIGRGSFAPWYLERETNKGGEFKVSAAQPLLRGRAIDPGRVAVFQASLARQAAQPLLEQAILDASLDASLRYWQWMAAGAVLQAQRELRDLAERRGKQFEVGVKAGKFAEIDLILNSQLIAERRGKVLESEQKYRAAGLKLALYLRDGSGQPLVPSDDWLPEYFPVIEPILQTSAEEDIAVAINSRPATRRLLFELRQLQLDRRLACNQLMPQLDLIAEASQDTGEPTSKKRDKSEFELLVGLQAELPIQRRKARGKLQTTLAKINQVNEKLRLQQNKIEIEIRTYRNAVALTTQVVDQSEQSLRAAFETLVRYRFAFERGKVDLIYLNLLESKANETEIKLVEAQSNWFVAVANLQRALGLDPLDEAMTLSALPPSRRPGPGHLPEPKPVKPKNFDLDWERHEIAE